MNYHITTPVSQQDWHDYYDLRWQILRKPWQQPRGSEKDELEDSAYHCLIKDENDNAIAVGRLHYLEDNIAQIRYMAVAPRHINRGLGSMVLKQLENVARKDNIQTIILHARENAAGFYEKRGYRCLAPSHTLFNIINHVLMTKQLTE